MEQVWKNGPQDGYTWFAQIKECYDALIDEQSKEIFQARFMLDIESRRKHYEILWKYLISVNQNINLKDTLQKILDDDIPVYLYGIGGLGRNCAILFQNLDANILGIFDRNYEDIGTFKGIPVLAPPQSIHEINEQAIIAISTISHWKEIYQDLKRIGIAENKIIVLAQENQYFDFMDKYIHGTCFIDAGSLDCRTAFEFHEKTKGKYNHIIAFEPDKISFEKCLNIIKENHLEKIKIHPVGLSKEEGAVCFLATHDGSSLISQNGLDKIKVVRLDSIVQDETIGFIKMDIEGSELDALQGAASIIQRDHPLCAISVYHKAGDIVVIMQYLKQLVPEYHFALRHYRVCATETVLYAFT